MQEIKNTFYIFEFSHSQCFDFIFIKSVSLFIVIKINSNMYDLDIRDWSARHVSTWLRSLSLSVYEKVFLENNIDGDYLVNDLDESSLDVLGVRLPGHRRKLLSALSDLLKK